jgi:hypothetical protein
VPVAGRRGAQIEARAPTRQSILPPHATAWSARTRQQRVLPVSALAQPPLSVVCGGGGSGLHDV